MQWHTRKAHLLGWFLVVLGETLGDILCETLGDIIGETLSDILGDILAKYGASLRE
jgi:hypothetical protein